MSRALCEHLAGHCVLYPNLIIKQFDANDLSREIKAILTGPLELDQKFTFKLPGKQLTKESKQYSTANMVPI